MDLKYIDLNQIISIIALNDYGINTSIKKQKLLE